MRGERLLRQCVRGAVLGGAERITQSGDDQGADGLRIAEPELGLGRMNVHVDFMRRKRQEQREHRMAPVGQEVAAARPAPASSLSRTGLLFTTRYWARPFGWCNVGRPAKPSTAAAPCAPHTGNASATNSSPRMLAKTRQPMFEQSGGLEP